MHYNKKMGKMHQSHFFNDGYFIFNACNLKAKMGEQRNQNRRRNIHTPKIRQ